MYYIAQCVLSKKWFCPLNPSTKKRSGVSPRACGSMRPTIYWSPGGQILVVSSISNLFSAQRTDKRGNFWIAKPYYHIILYNSNLHTLLTLVQIFISRNYSI